MTRAEKQTFIEEFKGRIERSEAVYLTDFTGLDVKAMTELRRRVRESGGEYVVVKNRIVMRAFEQAEWPDLSEYLRGPTGVVLGLDEAAGSARAVKDFAQDHDKKPSFKAGVLERTLVDSDAIQRIADLPSREELLAQLAGLMDGIPAALVQAVQGKVQEFAGLLDALREQHDETTG